MTRWAALALSLVVGSEAAAQACAPREVVVNRLIEEYGEALVMQGISSSGPMIEWFGSSVAQGWTIIVTQPNGLSCILAVGQGFYVVPTGLPI